MTTLLYIATIHKLELCFDSISKISFHDLPTFLISDAAKRA